MDSKSIKAKYLIYKSLLSETKYEDSILFLSEAIELCPDWSEHYAYRAKKIY